MSNTKPFEADAPKQIDPITEGVHQLRLQHKANVEAHRAAFEARAEQEYQRYLARQKESFITKYREDHYVRPPYPYADLSPAGQYRVSLPNDQRLEKLAAVKEYGELLYCLLARAGGKISVSEVQQQFKPYLPVTGDTNITEDVGTSGARRMVTHATGLSKELADLLTQTWLVDVEFGQVLWKEKDFEISEY
jgi:hypothetical protein